MKYDTVDGLYYQYKKMYNVMFSYYIISYEAILYSHETKMLYSSVSIDIESYNSEWNLDSIWYKIEAYDLYDIMWNYTLISKTKKKIIFSEFIFYDKNDLIKVMLCFGNLCNRW